MTAEHAFSTPDFEARAARERREQAAASEPVPDPGTTLGQVLDDLGVRADPRAMRRIGKARKAIVVAMLDGPVPGVEVITTFTAGPLNSMEALGLLTSAQAAMTSDRQEHAVQQHTLDQLT